MNRSELDVLAYLVPRRGSFWRWSRGAQGVEWLDGRTLAFRQEIIDVLAHLAPGGLPPFGAVLLLLAASRDNWTAADNRARILSLGAGIAPYDVAGIPQSGTRVVSSLVWAKARAEIAGVLDDLDRIAELPPELRQSLRAKCVIAETAFEAGQRAVPPLATDAIVMALTQGFDPEPLFDTDKSDDALEQFQMELRSLRTGLAQLDAERLRLRIQTGLDQIVEPAPLDLPDPLRVRHLLARLRDDPELAGVAQIARNLLAAIHIPRALAAPQDLPVGGVSDISSRGELDRLLVSELAHDDLTLATRIALKEALYLRREAPVSTPPRGRIILIDTGIRLWGVPRVFATSVGLALAASSEAKRISCFRPHGKAVHSADLTTREGLLAQLEALNPCPHPGEAVREMIRSLEEDRKDADVMIVTHDDASTDPDFGRLLRAIDPDRDWYVATVNGEGDFRLHLTGPDGRRALCSAQLSLEALLAPASSKRPAPTPLRDVTVDPTLPVILSSDPFPLLLPVQAEARRAIVSNKYGLLSVTRDGRLMRWRDELHGASELCPGAPPGAMMGFHVDEESGFVFYVTCETPPGKRPRTHVLVGNPQESVWRRPEIRATEMLRASAHHGGVLLLLYDKRVLALDAHGQTVADGSAPEASRWHSGRFYRCGAGWYAAHFDGQDIGFSRVTERDSLAIFDRKGHGPWQLMRGGHVAAVTGPPLVTREPPNLRAIDSFQMSNNGMRILVHGWVGKASHGREAYLLDLKAPFTWRKVPPGSHAALLGDPLRWSRSCGVNVYTHFDAISADDAGDVVLVRRGRRLVVRLSASGNLCLERMSRADGDLRTSTTVSFGRARPAPGARFRLRRAEWKDGSRAFLDSRGMLHLKSADVRLPEITIILSDRSLGGRTSEGHTFGWAFFHPEPPTAGDVYVHALLRRFTARLR
jgi:hypothetical protein